MTSSSTKKHQICDPMNFNKRLRDSGGFFQTKTSENRGLEASSSFPNDERPGALFAPQSVVRVYANN